MNSPTSSAVSRNIPFTSSFDCIIALPWNHQPPSALLCGADNALPLQTITVPPYSWKTPVPSAIFPSALTAISLPIHSFIHKRNLAPSRPSIAFPDLITYVGEPPLADP